MLARFCLRTIILLVFAAFSSIEFGRSFAALLWMAIIVSSIIGLVRREPPFDAALNRWDETVAYLALFALVSVFNHSAPV